MLCQKGSKNQDFTSDEQPQDTRGAFASVGGHGHQGVKAEWPVVLYPWASAALEGTETRAAIPLDQPSERSRGVFYTESHFLSLPSVIYAHPEGDRIGGDLGPVRRV